MRTVISSKGHAFEPRSLVRLTWDRVSTDSLTRNSAFMMATAAVTSLVGYVYWIVAAHLYSPTQIGVASSLIGAMTVVSSVSSTGICASLVQVLPRRAPGSQWSLTVNAAMAAGMTTGLAAGILESLILPHLSPQFSSLRQAGAMAVIIMSVPLWNLSLLLDYVFVAERAAGKMLVRNTAFVVLKIPFLALPLALADAGAFGIFWSWLLAACATVIGAMFLLVPDIGRSYCLVLRGIGAQIRSMLASLAGHHLISVAAMAPAYLLTVLVTARLSSARAAYFYTAWMVGNVFFMVSPAVAIALFAEGSHATRDIVRKVRTSGSIIGLCLAPAMVVAFLGGSFLLSLFGSNYARHGLILLWVLALSAIPTSIVDVYVSVLRVQGRLRWAAALNLGLATLTIMLTWVLLPILGIVGGGVAWLIAKLIGSLIALVDCLRSRYENRRRRVMQSQRREEGGQRRRCKPVPWPPCQGASQAGLFPHKQG